MTFYGSNGFMVNIRNKWLGGILVQLKIPVGTRRSYAKLRRNSSLDERLRCNILSREDMLGFLIAHINAFGARSYGQQYISPGTPLLLGCSCKKVPINMRLRKYCNLTN